jgi:hypothetical protein
VLGVSAAIGKLPFDVFPGEAGSYRSKMLSPRAFRNPDASKTGGNHCQDYLVPGELHQERSQPAVGILLAKHDYLALSRAELVCRFEHEM